MKIMTFQGNQCYKKRTDLFGIKIMEIMRKMFLPGWVALPLAGFAIFDLSEGHFGCQNGIGFH